MESGFAHAARSVSRRCRMRVRFVLRQVILGYDLRFVVVLRARIAYRLDVEQWHIQATQTETVLIEL